MAGLQGHAKKLLAASTSAHYGLMWLRSAPATRGAALLHFVVHAFFKAGLFLASGIAEHQVGSYALGAMRLGRSLPGIAVATLTASLALAGVPPLGGAWSKEQIVSAAGHHGTWLALATMLAGAFSAHYATRLQWLGFGPAPARHARPVVAPATPNAWPCTCSAPVHCCSRCCGGRASPKRSGTGWASSCRPASLGKCCCRGCWSGWACSAAR